MRGTIEEADEMIRSLDECIGELETGMSWKCVGVDVLL